MTLDQALRISLEAAVLAAAVALLCRALRRLAAKHRALLWFMVGAKLLIGLVPLPAVRVAALPAPKVLAAPAAASSEGRLATSASPANASAAIVSPARAAGWLWLFGGSVFVLAGLPDWVRVRRWLRAGRVVDSDKSRLAIARALSAVGLRRAPPVLAVPGLDAPVVTGFFRPTVLLPAEDLERLGPEELEMTLAHEMAHVARGDLWLGLVPALARRIFFFHPAAWIAEREYAIAREAACDEAVLARRGADPFAYGQLLLRLTTRRPVLTAIPMSPPSMLRRRLEMIETMVRRVPIGRAGWALVAVAALAVVPVQLVAKESRQASAPRCLDLGKGSDDAYVVTSGDSHSMCGDIDDTGLAERQRRKGEDVIWFRVDGESWIVRDPAVVKDAQHLFARVEAIGERQASIGEKQSKIGVEQSLIGTKQGEIGMKQALTAQLQAELALEKAREGLQRSSGESDAAAELMEEAQADRERAERKAASDGETMSALGARMEALGDAQEALGRQQQVLAEKLERELAEARIALTQLLERAMRDGAAQRVD